MPSAGAMIRRSAAATAFGEVGGSLNTAGVVGASRGRRASAIERPPPPPLLAPALGNKGLVSRPPQMGARSQIETSLDDSSGSRSHSGSTSDTADYGAVR